MNSNQPNVTDPEQRSRGLAKTLAVALVLSLAGVGAAHACGGKLKVINNSVQDFKADNVYTRLAARSQGRTYNYSVNPEVKAGEEGTFDIATWRLPSTIFRIILTSSTHKESLSTHGKCRDGWTIRIEPGSEIVP